MRPPCKKTLQARGQSYSYASGLHPVPAFYKHHWQIFTLDAPWEGDEFLAKAPRLSTAACMQRLEELQARRALYILYGGKRPRRFDGMPFDPRSDRWRHADWAPALDDDPDPAWNGHR